MKPRVGLTTYREPVLHHDRPRPAAYLPTSYLDSVVAAGGIPILLPSLDPADAVDALSGLDAVIVTGGHDIDAARYGEAPHPMTETARSERDAWEDAVVGAALAADLPFLGICRGLQVLNVHLGGTLIQHVPDVVGHSRYAHTGEEYAWNPASTVPGSRLAAILRGPRGDRDELPVRTSHHQAIGELAPGLEVAARSADGLVYGVEVTGRRWAFAVQWHPEEATDEGLFAALVAAARAD